MIHLELINGDSDIDPLAIQLYLDAEIPLLVPANKSNENSICIIL